MVNTNPISFPFSGMCRELEREAIFSHLCKKPYSDAQKRFMFFVFYLHYFLIGATHLPVQAHRQELISGKENIIPQQRFVSRAHFGNFSNPCFWPCKQMANAAILVQLITYVCTGTAVTLTHPSHPVDLMLSSNFPCTLSIPFTKPLRKIITFSHLMLKTLSYQFFIVTKSQKLTQNFMVWQQTVTD